MARKKPNPSAAFVLFDVLYEDGTRSSNRRVPSTELDGPDGDEGARSFLEVQDGKIAEQSGRRRAQIKSISRSRVR